MNQDRNSGEVFRSFVYYSRCALPGSSFIPFADIRFSAFLLSACFAVKCDLDEA